MKKNNLIWQMENGKYKIWMLMFCLVVPVFVPSAFGGEGWGFLFAQDTKVSWYSFSSGFSASSSISTKDISSVGESMIGTSSNGSSKIMSGFLTFRLNNTNTANIQNLPISVGAGSAEVWGDSIYHFGGSNSWTGTIIYPRVYKFDGIGWSLLDSIPDYSLWGVETEIVGNEVYLIGGYPSGASLIRKYNLITNEWENLKASPNVNQVFGLTAEYYNGKIYLFNNAGEVFAYDISGNSWETKTLNSAKGIYSNVRSVLYNNDIYIIGWNNSAFYKYTPSLDQWTELAISPYQFCAGAMGVINSQIYCIGGNNGINYASYKSALIYDVTNNSWIIDSASISSNRDWMAKANYQGKFYVLGGLAASSFAVDIVEEILPYGTVGVNEEEEMIPVSYNLNQNYPNPFNPTTTIQFSLPQAGDITLKIYNLLGEEVKTLVEEYREAGNHSVDFNASQLASGIYFYRLQAGSFIETKKMILLK